MNLITFLILVVIFYILFFKKSTEAFEPRTQYLSDYFVDNLYNYSNSTIDRNSNYTTFISGTEGSTSGIDLDKVKLEDLDAYQYGKLVAMLKGGGQVQLTKNML